MMKASVAATVHPGARQRFSKPTAERRAGGTQGDDGNVVR